MINFHKKIIFIGMYNKIVSILLNPIIQSTSLIVSILSIIDIHAEDKLII